MHCPPHQRVVLEGSYSGFPDVKAGLPQWTILGPHGLLFLIYIYVVNDIGSIQLFADDTSLYTYIIVEDLSMAAWKRVNIPQALKYQLDRNTYLEYADIILTLKKRDIEKVQCEAGRLVY